MSDTHARTREASFEFRTAREMSSDFKTTRKASFELKTTGEASFELVSGLCWLILSRIGCSPQNSECSFTFTCHDQIWDQGSVVWDLELR